MVAIEVIGRMDCSDGTLESANRVYSADGLCPTISTCGGGRTSAEDNSEEKHEL